MSTSNEPTSVPDSSLSAWFKARIERLHNVSEESDLQAQLGDLFTDNARIVLNHKPISVDDFNREFASRRFAVVGETLEWQHIVDVEDIAGGDGPRPDNEAGTVAGSYVVTRSLKFRIRVTPAQRKSHVVFSAVVENDPKQAGDGRKISEMFLTMVDKAVPINLPHIHNVSA